MDSTIRADAFERLADDLHRRLLDDARVSAHSAALGEGRPDAEARVRDLVDRDAPALAAADRATLATRILERSLGLGVLEPLLRDESVDEILVSGTRPVWVERRGLLEPAGVAFASEADLRDVIERLIAPAGRRVDEAEPLCDARLPDGSRVNVVLPPLAADGPAVTIRRFRRRALLPDDMVAGGSWTPPLSELLAAAVRSGCNVLVCGATGSGKTTTLGALAAFLDPAERVVTIEDTAELRLAGAHVVRLEARPAGHDGRGEVTIRDLLRNALRMRPDRIVIGEVRGPEALDMLMAMATGHDGALGTVHAGSPAQALRRVETLALMAGSGLSHEAVRRQVAETVDLVVHQERGRDGARRVTRVAEVLAGEDATALGHVYALRDGRPLVRAPRDRELADRLRLDAA